MQIIHLGGTSYYIISRVYKLPIESLALTLSLTLALTSMSTHTLSMRLTSLVFSSKVNGLPIMLAILLIPLAFHREISKFYIITQTRQSSISLAKQKLVTHLLMKMSLLSINYSPSLGTLIQSYFNSNLTRKKPFSHE